MSLQGSFKCSDFLRVVQNRREEAVVASLHIGLSYLTHSFLSKVPAVSRTLFTWRGCCGLCFWHTPTELAYSLFIQFLCLLALSTVFYPNKFSRQLSAFSLYSPGLISAVLVPFNHISLYQSLRPP